MKTATELAQQIADQELEACEEWLPSDLTIDGQSLRDVRRPKPPSLAEEALEHLSLIETAFNIAYGGDLVDTPIRRALERLQELEGGNG